MKKYNIKDFIGGWIVGSFSPSIIKTNNYEIAVKYYNKGDCEEKHTHKLADEITLVAQGSVKMNNIQYNKGDIIYIEKKEFTDFEVLDDNTITVVIKTPSIKNDKFFISDT